MRILPFNSTSNFTKMYNIRLISPLRVQIRSICMKGVDMSPYLPVYGPQEVQRSQLLNGVGVAAAKNMGAQMAAITIMYQAGSRYEVDDQLGASHFIRATSDCTSWGYSDFTKTRSLMQLGASITCSSDRQTVAYTLRCPLVIFPEVKAFFLDTACRPCFYQWQIDDRKYIVREDLHRMTPQQRVLDLVQKACWGGPLSNSIFCEEERIEGMTSKALERFFAMNFKTNQCTIASVGLPYEETIRFAESIDLCRDMPPPRCDELPYPRSGFELYDLGKGSDTWIALAVPSVGTLELRCLVIYAIIAAACGVGNVSSGQHVLDRAPQSPLCTMAGLDVYTEYIAFNISYRDTGLFGILARSKAQNAWKTAIAASEFLIQVGDLSCDQICVGKNRLKMDLAIHDEDCTRISEGMALQLANQVFLNSSRNYMDLIDSITVEEISAAAKMITCNCKNMAYAVVGDLCCVPHDRELVCCCPSYGE